MHYITSSSQTQNQTQRMATFQMKKSAIFFSLLNLCSMMVLVSSRGAIYTPPDVEKLTDQFSRIRANQGFNVSFGGSNVRFTNNGTNVDLILDKTTGSGLSSKNKYFYGFFNAAMKLPAGSTSGIVIAFYLSNAEDFPHNHDEIDFELLGNNKRRDWVLQTNLYGNGSTRTGREEKIYLWFDPTKDFHDYSILWNNHHILFLVDNIPIRQVIHNTAISPVYPAKPMSLHATIWDASEWATHGGKYAVNYAHSPFTASMRGVEMEGCIVQKSSNQSCSRNSISSLDPVEGQEFAKLTHKQIAALAWSRRKSMYYSYCQDTARFKVLPPECTSK